MKIVCAVAVAICVSMPAFAGFDGPIQTSVGLMGGKSMTGVHGQASFASLDVDWSRVFLSRTELTWGLQPFFIQQPSHFFVRDGHGSQNALALQLTLGLRHQFRSVSASIRPFLEIGSGPMFSNRKVPVTASNVNFDSFGTLGATFHVRNGYAPYFGFRFQHISNGGIVADRNPGYNVGSVVFGVRCVR